MKYLYRLLIPAFFLSCLFFIQPVHAATITVTGSSQRRQERNSKTARLSAVCRSSATAKPACWRKALPRRSLAIPALWQIVVECRSEREQQDLFEHLREVLLQFPIRKRIPNLDRFSKAQQIINVPVRLSR